MKKILIINGNSKENSFCHQLAESYAKGARDSGYEVKLVHLSKLDFDPVTRSGYDVIQELEPDLDNLKNELSAANHLVFVYPVWWGSVPALLKGALDRILLPGFAFKYDKGDTLPKQLLKGRSARLIVTMDTPTWYFKWIYGAPAHKMMKRTVLEFCGIKPVKLTEFGALIKSNEGQRKKWLNQAFKLGLNAA